MMTEEQVRDSFVKERRNLIAVSMIAFFYQLGDVTFSSINVFGTTVEINRPVGVTIFLAIILGYFLLRYIQFFNEMGNKGFDNQYKSRKIKLLRKIVERQLDRESPTGATNVHHMVKIWKPPLRKAWNEIHVAGSFTVIVTDPNTGARSSGSEIPVDRVVNGFAAFWLPMRAGVHVLFIRPLFFEYVLPLVIAAAPVAYFVWHLTLEFVRR